MFDEKFVKELPQDIVEAQRIICDRFFQYRKGKPSQGMVTFCLQSLAFARVFAQIHSLDLEVPSLDPNDADGSTINSVTKFFTVWKSQTDEVLRQRKHAGTYETAVDYYASLFGKGVFYEFSDGDFARIQTLLNGLRDLLTKSEDFEEEHRMRLLKKLEALQSELHKRMSNFDRFWGFFIDSGIALSKFWENAKPFRDDVKEIIEIVSRTQAKAENVQKLFPMNLLKSGDDSDSTSNTG
jgi:hypothetical protein